MMEMELKAGGYWSGMSRSGDLEDFINAPKEETTADAETNSEGATKAGS